MASRSCPNRTCPQRSGSAGARQIMRIQAPARHSFSTSFNARGGSRFRICSIGAISVIGAGENGRVRPACRRFSANSVPLSLLSDGGKRRQRRLALRPGDEGKRVEHVDEVALVESSTRASTRACSCARRRGEASAATASRARRDDRAGTPPIPRRHRHRQLVDHRGGHVRAAAQPHQVVRDEAVEDAAQEPVQRLVARLAQAEDRVRRDRCRPG